MVVVATKTFNKDISAIKDRKLARKIEETIRKIEQANSISEIQNLKKLSGAPHAYRIRIGDYRLGFFFTNRKVQLTAFAHRRDIYRLFP